MVQVPNQSSSLPSLPPTHLPQKTSILYAPAPHTSSYIQSPSSQVCRKVSHPNQRKRSQRPSEARRSRGSIDAVGNRQKYWLEQLERSGEELRRIWGGAGRTSRCVYGLSSSLGGIYVRIVFQNKLQLKLLGMESRRMSRIGIFWQSNHYLGTFTSNSQYKLGLSPCNYQHTKKYQVKQAG